MPSRRESKFAEVMVDRLLVESFANESSAYFKTMEDRARDDMFDHYRSRLKWHLSRSLSKRQKEVMQLYLMGKKQREIGAILGITQQVVSIYKRRAINKLRKILSE